MNLDQLRETFRQWQDAPVPKERNQHLKTLRAALTPTPVADDPVTAALAQVDRDAPDLQAQLRAALEPARPAAVTFHAADPTGPDGDVVLPVGHPERRPGRDSPGRGNRSVRRQWRIGEKPTLAASGRRGGGRASGDG